MNKIIFTDLDGTLTLKDTYTQFVFQNLSFKTVFQNLTTLIMMGIRHTLKLLNDDDVKKITFGMFFTGYDKTKEISSFIHEIPWNPHVLEMIEERRAEGYKVIIVTASPDVYVTHVCHYLNYDGFISTKTLSDGELLTGELDGEVCNFEQKPKRIEAFLNGAKPEHTIGFGNSSGDYAMLGYCDEAYFVKKSKIKRFKK
ncbi:MAG: haloacid dehalogenase-like hydrolase [Campylobacterales bacterium]|nr:haloacid dehalogenase-like hydrolase [Campylobacterales bacterium]